MSTSTVSPKKGLEADQYLKAGSSHVLDLYKVINAIWTTATQPNQQQAVFALVKKIQ